MNTAAAVLNTYRSAMEGNLRSLIAWDSWRLQEREQTARDYPSPRNRRRVAYMRKKIASMNADLQRQQERQAA
jgi:hypothetical protein